MVSFHLPFVFLFVLFSFVLLFLPPDPSSSGQEKIQIERVTHLFLRVNRGTDSVYPRVICKHPHPPPPPALSSLSLCSLSLSFSSFPSLALSRQRPIKKSPFLCSRTRVYDACIHTPHPRCPNHYTPHTTPTPDTRHPTHTCSIPQPMEHTASCRAYACQARQGQPTRRSRWWWRERHPYP